MTETPLTGGCNCGAIRYAIVAPPIVVMACHCTQCRRQSGATFSVNLIVRADTVVMEGTPDTWIDTDTASGSPMARDFCGRCGSPIRSVPAAGPIAVVKAGSLDSPHGFAPQMHVWTASKLGWVTIPDGMPTFAGNPPG